MSRNSSRVQAEMPEQSQPPEQQVRRNTSSTEMVELPSGGKFYPPGHALHGKDSIEIRFMTARDEDTLTSPTLLKKGLALDKFIQNILVDQSINIDDLIISDKSAIMIAARITGYGPEYEVRVTCKDCDSEVDHEFDLSDYGKYFVKEQSAGTPFEVQNDGTFSATLPMSGKTVNLKLLTSRDESRIEKQAELKAKNKLTESTTTDLLKSIVCAVDGQADKNVIAEEIENLPARDSLFIRKNYSKLIPKVEMKEEYECRYCGAESEMEVPLEATFFWPGT
jgi:hypothetical protein